MKRLLYILLLILPLTAAYSQQDNLPVDEESNTLNVQQVEMGNGQIIFMETEQTIQTDTTHTVHFDYQTWKPNPLKSAWLAAIVPGLGQIYNKSYWKLPIVYGALAGCIYAITWNSNQYQDYKQAYRDILIDGGTSTDPNRSYNAVLTRWGYTIERMGGVQKYTETLKEKQTTYHRYRDLSIVVAVGIYALTIVDAFVDAQLFDFDISPDLSLNIEPQIYYDIRNEHRHSAEIKLAFTIK